MGTTHILSLVVFNHKAKVQNPSLKFFHSIFSPPTMCHKKAVHANIYLENVVNQKAKGKILCLEFQFFFPQESSSVHEIPISATRGQSKH